MKGKGRWGNPLCSIRAVSRYLAIGGYERKIMYWVKVICKKCGSELPIVDEFKDGAKKDFFVEPCPTCLEKGLEFEKLYGETEMIEHR